MCSSISFCIPGNVFIINLNGLECLLHAGPVAVFSLPRAKSHFALAILHLQLAITVHVLPTVARWPRLRCCNANKLYPRTKKFCYIPSSVDRYQEVVIETPIQDAVMLALNRIPIVMFSDHSPVFSDQTLSLTKRDGVTW
ncbi:hypothetical protein C8R42DRAFT_639205 [Lentinula raphanica]|nr:hypothetical protein C8R42DRAFT_639205 [Lentinula raphanica]